MTVNRRHFLRGSLLVVANMTILAACAPQPAAPAKPAETGAAKPQATSAAAAPAATTAPAAPPTAVAKPPESKPAADAKPASRTPAGELKIGLHAKLTTLDPQGAQSVDGISQTAMQHVFDPLVGRDAATGNLLPKLATSWESPDPTTWVFKLRPGVKFHDGADFSANDVKASLERTIAQKGPVAPLFAAVEAVETPDPMTVRLKMKQPVGTIPTSMTLLNVGPAAQINTDGFFNKPIGTGPFKFVSWRADADLRLEANDGYWGGPPASKVLVFKYIPELASRITALETGEIDFIWNVPPDQLDEIKRNADLKVETIPSHSYYFVWFNSGRETFADKRVRQAMIYALDIDTILKDLLPGLGQRATAPIPPTVFGHAPQTPYTYDVAKAKQLLAEAGKPNGFETAFMWYGGSGPQNREIGQALVSYWNAIGVKAKSDEQERATWLDNYTKLNWDMNFSTNPVTTGDADYTLGRLYHSRANRTGYKNPDLDKILDDAAGALDQQKRKELYAQANKILWDDAVGIYLFDLNTAFAMRKTLTGFTPTPSAFLTFYDSASKP